MLIAQEEIVVYERHKMGCKKHCGTTRRRSGWRSVRGLRPAARRRDAHARSGHFAGAVHAQFIEHASAGFEIGCQTFYQPGDMKENVAAAVVGPKESETLSLEIGDYASWLFAGGSFFSGFAAAATPCERDEMSCRRRPV